MIASMSIFRPFAWGTVLVFYKNGTRLFSLTSIINFCQVGCQSSVRVEVTLDLPDAVTSAHTVRRDYELHIIDLGYAARICQLVQGTPPVM